MCHLPNSKLFPPRKSFASDIPARDRNVANLFLRCSDLLTLLQSLLITVICIEKRENENILGYNCNALSDTKTNSEYKTTILEGSKICLLHFLRVHIFLLTLMLRDRSKFFSRNEHLLFKQEFSSSARHRGN